MNPTPDGWEDECPDGLKADLAIARAASGAIDIETGAARLATVLAAAPAAAAPPPHGPLAHPAWWGACAVGLASVALVAYLAGTSHGGQQPAAPRVPVGAIAEPAIDATAAAAPTAELPSISVAELPSVAASSRAVAPPRAPTAASDLDRVREEVDQAAAARTMLAARPNDALAAAEAGHRRFPSGVVYPEREAIAIEALTRLGRHDEARSRAAVFLQQTPKGPLAERVRRLVSESP